MRAVDTNVLVRLLTGDSPEQTAIAENYIANGAWVPQLAVAETAWVLAAIYDRSSQSIAAAIDMLLDHDALTVQDADVVKTAVEEFRQQSGISFSDCLLVAVARKAGHTPIGTFDRRFGRLEDVEQL